MSTGIFDAKAVKRPVNLRVNSELLRQAKALKINLSKAVEQHLESLARAARSQQWLEENQNAIEEYNARIERCGVFSDCLRQW